MTELGAAERNLLAVLAEADEPTDADRERVRALVLQRVATATSIAAATYVAGSGSVAASGAAAASSAGTIPAAAVASSTTASSALASSGAVTAAATTAAVTWKGAIAAKITAAVVGVGVASGAGWYAVKSQSPSETTVAAPQTVAIAVKPSPAQQPVAAPVLAAAEAEPVVEAPKPVEAPAVVHRAAPVEVKANDHLNDEAELLKRVQRAINSGDSATALSLLQQHATTYPTGVLVQERIGLRAITLCRAGQHEQGVAEATRFLKGNPSSPLSERVKSACELK